MSIMKYAHKTLMTKVLVFLTGATGYFYAASAHALTVNVATMIENLSLAMPNLMRLVTALAYVMGMYFVYNGILELKKYGESRTMMSQEHHLKKPLTMLAVGTALLYLPTSVQTGMSTFWTNPAPYAYVSQVADPWSELIKACFMIVQLIGTISFIRGLVILSHTGGQSNQPGTFGRAMAHIIAGILCIDMYDFVQAVMNTLALGQI